MRAKQQDEKVFGLSGDIRARCWWEKTRYGFRHLAVLTVNWQAESRAKVCYQNRTWETYRYESVLKKLVENSGLSDYDKKSCMDKVNETKEPESFNALKGILAMGKLMNADASKKIKNDFSLRMIKAQFEKSGLSVPDDWNELSEDEKEKRLDGIASIL